MDSRLCAGLLKRVDFFFPNFRTDQTEVKADTDRTKKRRISYTYFDVT